MIRPPMPKGGSYTVCPCGEILQTREQTALHWSGGHFDYNDGERGEKTLRDEFAMAALTGLAQKRQFYNSTKGIQVASYEPPTDDIARKAFALADSMLSARKGPEGDK